VSVGELLDGAVGAVEAEQEGELLAEHDLKADLGLLINGGHAESPTGGVAQNDEATAGIEIEGASASEGDHGTDLQSLNRDTNLLGLMLADGVRETHELGPGDHVDTQPEVQHVGRGQIFVQLEAVERLAQEAAAGVVGGLGGEVPSNRRGQNQQRSGPVRGGLAEEEVMDRVLELVMLLGEMVDDHFVVCVVVFLLFRC